MDFSLVLAREDLGIFFFIFKRIKNSEIYLGGCKHTLIICTSVAFIWETLKVLRA